MSENSRISTNKGLSSRYHCNLPAELSPFFNNPLLHDLYIHPRPVSRPQRDNHDRLAKINRKYLQMRSPVELDLPDMYHAHTDVLRSRSITIHRILLEFQESHEVKIEEQVSSIRIMNQDEIEDRSILDDYEEDAVHIVMEYDSDVIFTVLKYIYNGSFDLFLDSEDPWFRSKLDSLKRRVLPQLTELARELNLENLVKFLTKHYQIIQGSGKSRTPTPRKMFIDSSNLMKHGKLTIVSSRGFEQDSVSAVLLAARSAFFNAMLSGHWNESNRSVVDVGDVPSDILRDILSFVHLDGELMIVDNKHCLSLLQWAYYFGISSLVSFCEFVIYSRFLNTENVCAIWNLVSTHGANDYLAQKCLDLLQRRFLECSSFSGFLTLRVELMKAALDSGKIECPSFEMMQAVRDWAEYQGGVGTEAAQRFFFMMMPPQTMFNAHNRMMLLGVQSSVIGVPLRYLTGF